MKHIFKSITSLAFLSGSLLLSSCDPEIEAPLISSGELDLSKYVAVGNSLTAGYMDGGVYREGQLTSYPNILAGQFRQAGGGEFVQPLFTEEQANGSGYLALTGFTPTGSPLLTKVTTKLAVRQEQPLPGGPKLTKFVDPALQNLAVPGMSVLASASTQYGALNPYYERLLPPAEVGAKSYLQFISGRNHTFFSLWLGNIDVLDYATAGGFAGSITDEGVFASNYTALVSALSANNTKGIVATIPDVTGIPFFTTVGPQVKASLTASGVAAVAVLTRNTSTRMLLPTATIRDGSGGNALLTLTSSAYVPLLGRPSGKYWRDLAKSQNPANWQLQLAGYLLNFAVDTTQAFGSGANPLPSALVLDSDEITLIQNATTAFNNVIRNQAAAKNLALFDAHAFFNQIQPVNGQPSYTLNGVSYSPAFLTGNLFSLDGVHPTPRGYAIVANEMIKAINGKYKVSIPTADVTQYRAVIFPNK